jgi:hypothetical protein
MYQCIAPQPTEAKRKPKSKKDFDPHTFNLKLTFTDEVAELGICEEDAKRL